MVCHRTSGFLSSYNVCLHLAKTILTALLGRYLGLFKTATSFYSCIVVDRKCFCCDVYEFSITIQLIIFVLVFEWFLWYISFCSSQFDCRFCAICLLWYIWSTSRSSSKWIFCSIAGNKSLVNLEALEKRYGISSEVPSHRAMPDVEALCNILPKITLDLKLTCDDLMNEAMRFSDVRKVSWIWVSDLLVVLVINIFDISFSWLLLHMV